MSGGPYSPRVIPVGGEVQAVWIDGAAPPITARATDDGDFVLRLWDGRFQLWGSSPHYNDGVGRCSGGEIIVDGDLTGVVIACAMK